MKNKYLLFLNFFLFLIIFIITDIKNDFFNIKKISYDIEYNSSWDVENNVNLEDVNDYLSNTFCYLGKGRQCFVFEDKKNDLIIKFFNQSKFIIIDFLKLFFIDKIYNFFNYGRIDYKLQKGLRSINSYALAFNYLKDETGIIYLHLNKTNNLFSKRLKILTKDKNANYIDLDNTCFVIQKKAKPLFLTIDCLFKKDINEAKKAIDGIVNIIQKRCDLCIYDSDFQMDSNFGFVNDKPIIFDCGRFIKNPHLILEKPKNIVKTRAHQNVLPDLILFATLT